MAQFWENYWWILVLAILLIFTLFFLWRWYQIFHLDYSWEKRRHFPQWTKEGIITRDNYLLHTEHHFVSDSKYIVIGIHGMGASKEDFEEVSKFLKAKQISFLTFDQRGWGENNRWKYHSLGTTISDIADVINVLNERLPNQKIILLGESLGSAVSALAAKKLAGSIAGVVLTNFVTKKSIFKINFKLFFKTVIGFIFYKHMHMPIKFDMQELSVNPEYIEYGNDRSMSNMPFTTLYALQAKKISSKVVKNINESQAPALIIQSGKDLFADLDRVKANEKKWRMGVTYKFYPEGKHAILNEPIIKDILQDTEKWIKENIN